MKLNEPITDEEHAAADAEFRRIAQSQARFINEIAAKMVAGEALSDYEREFGAAVLRGTAEQVASAQRPRKRGAKTKIPDQALVDYARWRAHEGMSQNAAIEKLAEEWETSITAVKKKIGMIGTAAEKQTAAKYLQEAFWLVGKPERDQ